MKCKACPKKATAWWGWTCPKTRQLLKAPLCPACRRRSTVKMIPLGKAT